MAETMDDDTAIRRTGYELADALASSLLPPDGIWASARQPSTWEHNALCWLEEMRGRIGPINGWTQMLLTEGYPAAKAGADQGKFWRPGAVARWENEAGH